MLNLGASADLSSLHLSTSSSSSFPACLPFENSIIISGGTRGLGRVVAAQLARRNVTLVLTSVSGQVDEAFLLDIKRRTHKTVVKQCDWSDESAVAKLLAWARESLPVVSLIVHAAGRMTPCNIVDMTEATFDDVVACKLNSLKEAMAFPSMEQWVISSISAVWSQSGGAHYTAASLFQQRMAESCIAKGIRMTSGAFGPFGGVGMAARYSDDMRALGLVALSPGETAPSFASSRGRSGFVYAQILPEILVAANSLKGTMSVFEDLGAGVAIGRSVSPDPDVDVDASAAAGAPHDVPQNAHSQAPLSEASIRQCVIDVLSEQLGIEDRDGTADIDLVNVDSITAVEVSASLSQILRHSWSGRRIRSVKQPTSIRGIERQEVYRGGSGCSTWEQAPT